MRVRVGAPLAWRIGRDVLHDHALAGCRCRAAGVSRAAATLRVGIYRRNELCRKAWRGNAAQAPPICFRRGPAVLLGQPYQTHHPGRLLLDGTHQGVQCLAEALAAREQLQEVALSGQDCLDALLLGDVGMRTHHAVQLAVRVTQGHPPSQDPAVRTVLVAQTELGRIDRVPALEVGVQSCQGRLHIAGVQ